MALDVYMVLHEERVMCTVISLIASIKVLLVDVRISECTCRMLVD